MFKGFYRLLAILMSSTHGAAGDIPDLTNPANPPANPPSNPPASIYGDIKPQWPEGFDSTLAEEPAFKTFVGADGKIHYPNMMKSYVNAQKAIGRDKIPVLGQNPTKEEIDEFHKKAFGYQTDINEYKLAKPDKSEIDDAFLAKFKEVAHKNRIPVQNATEMLSFIEKTSKEEMQASTDAYNTYVKQGVENMRKDFGEAFDRKMSAASRFVKELGGDVFIKFLKEQNLQSDPALLRVFAEAGEKLFKSGQLPGGGNGGEGGLTPAEIDVKINEMRGDPKSAFNNPNHPGFAAAQDEMLKLYRQKETVSQSSANLFS